MSRRAQIGRGFRVARAMQRVWVTMITSKLALIAGAAITVAGCAGHDDADPTARSTASQESAPGVPNHDVIANATAPLELVQPPEVKGDVYVALVSSGESCEESCPGDFWVRELNGTGPARYVRNLDLSALPQRAIAMAAGSGAGELLFRGEFGSIEEDSPGALAASVFYVHEAWRGLPGVTSPPLDVDTVVETSDGQLVAHILDGPWGQPIKSVSIDGISVPWVDPAWLDTRIMDHGAIVAGRFDGWTLDAAQVYLRLPDVVGPCAVERFAVHCDAEQVATYTMTDNLCLVFAGCAKPGLCPLVVARCEAGYDLVSWAGQPDGCQASTCEPTFISQ
jgi:hypothetical protein